jgi:polyphenol oxidase|tara:strand:+ start:7360 stop:8025 length:666 start_codon:yes stop_codon:yes gene_type:complete
MFHKFTDRLSGLSKGDFTSLNLGDHVGDLSADVSANRDILVARYGPIQYMNQVHGDRIICVEEVIPEAPIADALVTGIPGITLAVMVADCIPLLLTSREAVAAVHVGRRGLVNSVAKKTIEVMRSMGAYEITAHIGPAICGQCYEVPRQMHDEIVALHPRTTSQTNSGSHSLDLIAGLKEILVKSDVADITDVNICTYESKDYFSYRRSGVTGRQVGLVSL